MIGSPTPNLYWVSISICSNGQYQTACVNDAYLGGNIWISSDYGNTWIQTTATNDVWSAVASSSDGTKLFAAVNGGNIYTSNDRNTWIQTNAINSSWSSIACSSDGSIISAVNGSGEILANNKNFLITANFDKISSNDVSIVSAATSGGIFISLSPPNIALITPNFGPTNGGTSVIITGQNLSGATKVTFNGINAILKSDI